MSSTKQNAARELADMRPSQAVKDRVAELIHRQKVGGLSEVETSELQRYMELEHTMRLAKARARERLARRKP